MPPFRIAEVPSRLWELGPSLSRRAGRTSQTVRDYLLERGVEWSHRARGPADVYVYKPGLGSLRLRGRVKGWYRRLIGFRRPHVVLLGEPREHSPLEYAFAQPRTTLACAPGDTLPRLYYAAEWVDPQLDGWQSREDRFCWIGRPTPDRVDLARALEARGIPLDIYSRAPWPVASWRGYAADELETSRRYRYRIVAENHATFKYHSEKLFNGVRAGCVTFYAGDPTLELPHLRGGYVPLSMDAIAAAPDLAAGVLKGIETVMLSDAWEVYSYRAFFDRIIEMARGLRA